MSRVTNVILSFSVSEHLVEQADGPDLYPVLDPLNVWLGERQYGRGFVDVGHHAGGYKAFEANLYAFAANQMPTEEILEKIQALQWEIPEEVQVWIKDENDDLFTEYRIVNGALLPLL